MASFLGEIKRRKVFQVAAVYAVVSWLLIQVIATVERPLNLPDWFATVVIVALAVGFPVALILAWAFDITPDGLQTTSSNKLVAATKVPRGQQLSYFMQGLMLLAVGFLVADQYLFSGAGTQTRVAQSSQVVTRFSIPMSPEIISELTAAVGLALSADGRTVVYSTPDGLTQRNFASFRASLIPDSSGANTPFFSADGQWLGFYDGGLKSISTAGGRPERFLSDSALIMGATWAANATVIYGTSSSGLFQVSSNGGEPVAISEPSSTIESHRWPELLPSGRKVLFTITTGAVETGAPGAMEVAVLDLETRDVRALLPGSQPHWLPTGHLVFARESTLWAIPFDPDRAELTGEPRPVLENVGADFGVTQFTVGGGTLAYLFGIPSNERHLVLVDRDGGEERLPLEPREYWNPKLSPDGRRIHTSLADPIEAVWVGDIDGGVLSQISETDSETGFWMPDGASILYAGNRDGRRVTLRRRADGSGAELPVSLGDHTHHHLEDISRDGRFASWTELGAGRPELNTIWTSELTGEDMPSSFPPESVGVSGGWFSPDNRWLLYSAYESGQTHVYVSPYPEGGRRTLVSVGSGTEPAWSPDGREIFYRDRDRMMAVTVENSSTMELGRPRLLFEGQFVHQPLPAGSRNYDVSPDGRFLMVKPIEPIGQASFQMQVVLNWYDELSQLVPNER